MKQFFKRTLSLLLSASMALALAVPAGAAFADFKDVSGHWAKQTLQQAYTDGILSGYGDNIMAPDDSVTLAQAVTILCRVLHVSGQGDTSRLNIPAGAWYAPDAAKGVYAGLLDDSDAGALDKPVLRGHAFVLFDRAFQIGEADPDLTALNRFSDTAYLSGEEQRASASLVAAGILKGDELGRLTPDKTLTRAEFATILYRLVDRFTTAEAYANDGSSGVLAGDGSLTNVTGGKLWFDCNASNVSLNGVTADLIAVRSDRLDSFSLTGTGEIKRLILANGSGNVSMDLPDTCWVNTLTLGDGSGSVNYFGSTFLTEITGDGRTLNLNCSVDKLAISGDNNTVTLRKGFNIKSIVVSGKNNTIILDGSADKVLLTGRDNTVKGSGKAGEVTLNTRYATVSVSKDKLNKWADYSLDNLGLTLSAPDTLPAGQTLKVSADLTVPDGLKGKLCSAAWYLNGEPISEGPVLLGKDALTASITPNYNHSLVTNSTVKLVLTYENADGDTFTKEAKAPVKLQNFEDLGLADAVVTVSGTDTLPAGQTLSLTAAVDTPEKGQSCTGTWYVGGKHVSSAPLTLGQTPAPLSYQYTYSYGMPATSTVTFKVTYTTKDGRAQEVSGSKTVKVENYADNGIGGATATLTAPASVQVSATGGNSIAVNANLKFPQAGKVCTGTWYVDGKVFSTQTIRLGTDAPWINYTYSYSKELSNYTSTVKFVLSYTTPDGRKQEVSASANVAVKYQHGPSDADILKTVTSGYAGNYTLAWAQNHDYTADTKTRWVNLQGYKSSTKYLIWVNLTYQRVNIFEGSQGNWKLIRTCLCGSGKSSTPTIRGVFTTSYKQTAWDYGSYYCGPIVRFNGSSGYAFHSRLEYYPMYSDRYYDARIGFPISHGCLRMYNDDIRWMYNNIPNGTTVVVY